MARSPQRRDSAVDALTDHAPADRAAIRILPETSAKLEGSSRLKGAMSLEMSRISPDPDQPRKEFSAAELDGLARSIRNHGLLQPIRVRWHEGAWVIVSGERRYRACLMLGLKTIQAIEGDDGTRESVLSHQLVENCVREDLRPVEQAQAIKELMDLTGLNLTGVAEELGLSKSHVSRMLALLEAPDAVRAKVDSGELSIQSGVALSRLDPERAVEMAGQGGDTEEIREATGKAGRSYRPRQSKRVYEVADASVTVVFRRPDASARDFIAALREATAKAKAV